MKTKMARCGPTTTKNVFCMSSQCATVMESKTQATRPRPRTQLAMPEPRPRTRLSRPDQEQGLQNCPRGSSRTRTCCCNAASNYS